MCFLKEIPNWYCQAAPSFTDPNIYNFGKRKATPKQAEV